MPRAWAASLHAAAYSSRPGRRAATDRGHRCTGPPLWPLRLSQDRRASAQPDGLGGQRQAGRAHLAARGAEGSSQTTEERPALARRRIMHPPARRAAQPCLVLRLRRGPHS